MIAVLLVTNFLQFQIYGIKLLSTKNTPLLGVLAKGTCTYPHNCSIPRIQYITIVTLQQNIHEVPIDIDSLYNLIKITQTMQNLNCTLGFGNV